MRATLLTAVCRRARGHLGNRQESKTQLDTGLERFGNRSLQVSPFTLTTPLFKYVFVTPVVNNLGRRCTFDVAAARYKEVLSAAPVQLRERWPAVNTLGYVLCAASVRGERIVSGHWAVWISLSGRVWMEVTSSTRSGAQSLHSPVQFNVCIL